MHDRCFRGLDGYRCGCWCWCRRRFSDNSQSHGPGVRVYCSSPLRCVERPCKDVLVLCELQDRGGPIAGIYAAKSPAPRHRSFSVGSDEPGIGVIHTGKPGLPGEYIAAVGGLDDYTGRLINAHVPVDPVPDDIPGGREFNEKGISVDSFVIGPLCKRAGDEQVAVCGVDHRPGIVVIRAPERPVPDLVT